MGGWVAHVEQYWLPGLFLPPNPTLQCPSGMLRGIAPSGSLFGAALGCSPRVLLVTGVRLFHNIVACVEIVSQEVEHMCYHFMFTAHVNSTQDVTNCKQKCRKSKLNQV